MPLNGKLVAFVKLVVFILMVVAFLASLISIGTNYWIEHGNTHHQGLWFFCNDVDIGCLEFSQELGVPDWHYAVFGLFLITTTFQFVIVIICIVWLCAKKVSKCSYVGSLIFSGICWCCLVTSLGLYTRMFYPTIISEQLGYDYRWGYGFGLAWLSFILHTLALLISIVLALKDRNYKNKRYEHPDDMQYEY